MFRDWCVAIVSDVCEMFFESYNELSLCFADLLLFAFVAFQEIYHVVCVTINVLG